MPGRGRLCAADAVRGPGARPTAASGPGSPGRPPAACRSRRRSPTTRRPLLEVLGIALHALDLAGIRIDDASPSSAVRPGTGLRAGVYGAGPIGLRAHPRAAGGGRRQVVATDRLAAPRRGGARVSGATTSSWSPTTARTPAAAIQVDVAFECAGTDEALDTAVRAVAAGGRVLMVGIPGGDREHVPGVRRTPQGAGAPARAPDGGARPRARRRARGGRPHLARRPGQPPVRAGGRAAPRSSCSRARAGLKIVVEPARM